MTPSLLTATALLSFLSTLVSAHTVITYPGWRGNNLHSNFSRGDEPSYGNGLGVEDGNYYPFGMQWIYPCGGMPMSTNRTKWPVGGGAVGFQPGWFSGHSSALVYINLGEGTVPNNYSLVMQPMFAIRGPTNDIYKGEICMPQVPLPANFTAKVGDNATIQIIESAQHGAALYNCVDITFAEPEDVPEVTPQNCNNSTDIEIDFVFQASSLSSDASPALSRRTWMAASMPLLAAVAWAMLI